MDDVFFPDVYLQDVSMNTSTSIINLCCFLYLFLFSAYAAFRKCLLKMLMADRGLCSDGKFIVIADNKIAFGALSGHSRRRSHKRRNKNNRNVKKKTHTMYCRSNSHIR